MTFRNLELFLFLRFTNFSYSLTKVSTYSTKWTSVQIPSMILEMSDSMFFSFWIELNTIVGSFTSHLSGSSRFILCLIKFWSTKTARFFPKGLQIWIQNKKAPNLNTRIKFEYLLVFTPFCCHGKKQKKDSKFQDQKHF